MTNPYTFTDNATLKDVANCNPDILNENLMYLKYAVDNSIVMPIGIPFYDNGSLSRSTGVQLLNGATLDLSDSALYTAWKEAGFLGAKDGGFYDSAIRLKTMAANSDGGYTASSNHGNATAYLGMDDNPADYWDSGDVGGLDYYLQLDFPSPKIVTKHTVRSSTTYPTYMPLYYKAQIKVGGDWVDDTVYQYNGFSAGQTVSLNAINRVPADGARYYSMDSLGSFRPLIGDYGVFSLDLSVIKCTHGQTTGTAVRIGVEAGKTAPTGLAENTTYGLREGADANKCTLYDTVEHAIAGGATGLIAITDAGSGTFKLFPYPSVVLPTVANTYFTR